MLSLFLTMEYEAIIGLEIHAELKTKTKMFCQSLNDPDERHPNINICPVCMGHPGTLPVINSDAVKKVILVGLALKGNIPEFSQFDRKNYFYPDLPKGYQISQYQHPLVSGGVLKIDEKEIRITRVHLEEDTGRLIHDKESGVSLVDFNRAGVPLMELVTEPDLRNGEEVRKFGEKLQQILRYTGVSDADMEKGQMRVEVNISLRKRGEKFGTKVEIKNINSFKFAQEAAEYEIKRQSAALDEGKEVVQETRGWNEFEKKTFSQRKKESAHDYRYFPEPDLPPLELSEKFIDDLRASVPELPAGKIERFSKQYGIEKKVAEVLAKEKSFADFFEETASELLEHISENNHGEKQVFKDLSLFMIGDFQGILKEQKALVGDLQISPENLAELVAFIIEGKISNIAAKDVLKEMLHKNVEAKEAINSLALWQVSDEGELEKIADAVIAENPGEVNGYKKGKEQLIQFLIGQAMKKSAGKGNPKVIVEILKKKIGRT